MAPRPLGRRLVVWLERGVALALALLLLRSSFAHLGNAYYFLSSVYGYELAGLKTGQAVAVLLPFIQLVVAVCLLARWWLREAYGLSFVLFVGLAIVQAVTIRRGLDISCGCFGAADGFRVGAKTLTIAGTAALASAAGLIGSADRFTRPPSTTPPSPGGRQ